jgi:acetyl esterase/lipase
VSAGQRHPLPFPAVTGRPVCVHAGVAALLVAFCILFTPGRVTAQPSDWNPSPGHTQIPIWPGAAPDPQPVSGPETVKTTGSEELIAGRPYTYIINVTRPTMTVYSPTGRNTGAAVVVFPGGGYQMLAIDLEGTEVCDWLTSRGITCVLSKYRVTDAGGYPSAIPHRESPMALDDAQRTLGLVRLHAAEWHIDPHKIGVLGFSAGGHLSAAMSTEFAERAYRAVDAADAVSCRPDFAVALYPGHLAAGEKPFTLNPHIHVTSQTPPTFLVQTEDDSVDDVANSRLYYAALRQAGVPVEMHLYPHGGHGFGLRHTTQPVTEWPRLAEVWLRTIGIIPG